jgi:chromosome segregation ATPase
MAAKTIFLLAATGHNVVDASATEHRANPIRKVVTMLQMMQNKVSQEGAKKKEIFDKFMCYCDNADTLLGGAVQRANEKIPMLESAIGEDANEKKQLDADVEQHKADRIAAKDAVSKAIAIREKENIDYLKSSGDVKTNVEALEKAIPALEGLPGTAGFLQTSSAQVVRQLSINMDMSTVDRTMLTNFLASGSTSASGEIVGILKTMLDEMKADIAELTNTEEAAVAALEELKIAKAKEVDALTASIESKIARSGDLAVKHAEMINDLEDTREDLEETKKFMADLEVNCAKKKKEWAFYVKMQGEEMLALADTIKVLNDDDALELFKKTLPGSASALLQKKVSTKEVMSRALSQLQHVQGVHVDLLEVALRGGKQGFEKIITMVDKLTAELKEQQKDDDAKKSYCEAEFDKADDRKKSLAQDITDLETAIDDATEAIGTLKTEIEALDDGIRALDKEVETATENRQEEHEEFKAAYASNAVAVDLLKFAKNRLNKFYNPSQYKPPPKRELSEEEQITVNMGGTLAPTEAPGGIAGTGIGLLQRNGAAPPPPPEANLAYKTKGEESAGVIAMIDSIVNDVEKDMQESELEEKDAQGDYEKFMDDASTKRAEDSKSMTDKEAALADTQDQLNTDKGTLGNKKIAAMETEKKISALHAECDWLLKYYSVRKEARTSEIEAMGRAKDVLNGADYS